MRKTNRFPHLFYSKDLKTDKKTQTDTLFYEQFVKTRLKNKKRLDI